MHGFRSSFKTRAIEATTTPWAVGEAALAHVVGNSTEAAYVRGDLFEQRRDLMSVWADFVAPRPAAAPRDRLTVPDVFGLLRHLENRAKFPL